MSVILFFLLGFVFFLFGYHLSRGLISCERVGQIIRKLEYSVHKEGPIIPTIHSEQSRQINRNAAAKTPSLRPHHAQTLQDHFPLGFIPEIQIPDTYRHLDKPNGLVVAICRFSSECCLCDAFEMRS